MSALRLSNTAPAPRHHDQHHHDDDSSAEQNEHYALDLSGNVEKVGEAGLPKHPLKSQSGGQIPAASRQHNNAIAGIRVDAHGCADGRVVHAVVTKREVPTRHRRVRHDDEAPDIDALRRSARLSYRFNGGLSERFSWTIGNCANTNLVMSAADLLNPVAALDA